MTTDKPASRRQSALTGAMMLVAGFLSLMVMNPTISASVTGNPAAGNSVQRSVS